MLNLIKWLLFGHIHTWKILKVHDLKMMTGSVGSRYVLQCEKCGIVKKVDII